MTVKSFFCILRGANNVEVNKQINILLLKLKEDKQESAFQELYMLLYDTFFRIAYFYLKESESAQEIVQDVFLKLWHKKEELHTIKNFRGYCFILLKNASLNLLAKSTSQDSVSLEEHNIIHPVEPSVEKQLLNDELLLVYTQALEDFPPKCREVFILIKEEGFTYQQVADKLNISTKTVDNHLQKAISRLKEKINAYFSHSE